MATNPSIDQLASITTDGGLQTPSFAEIRNAYADAMKSIYGNDIDISSASADGQYIMAESLAINNIYRTLDSLYKNIQPASASGKYLDILASFTNTIRDMGTRSYIYLDCKYIGPNNTDTPEYLEVIDQYGNYWTWLNPISISSVQQVVFTKSVGASQYPQRLKFIARNIGPITVDSTTTFTQTINNAYSFTAAGASVAGTTKESDAALRSRRLFKTGVRSMTVIDTLRAWLYDINGIDDVFVFNNSTGGAVSMADGVSIPAHQVYCAVRPNSTLDTTSTAYKSNIGSTIYDAMTPGVLTTSAAIGGTAVTGANSLTIDIISGVQTTVYWKDAQPYRPTLKIIYKYDNNTTALSTKQQALIKTAILNYLNNFSISDTLIASTFLNLINNTDLKTPIEGLGTFHCTELHNSADATIDSLIMPLAYFDYTENDITFGSTGSPATYFIKIERVSP